MYSRDVLEAAWGVREPEAAPNPAAPWSKAPPPANPPHSLLPFGSADPHLGGVHYVHLVSVSAPPSCLASPVLMWTAPASKRAGRATCRGGLSIFTEPAHEVVILCARPSRKRHRVRPEMNRSRTSAFVPATAGYQHWGALLGCGVSAEFRLRVAPESTFLAGSPRNPGFAPPQNSGFASPRLSRCPNRWGYL